MILAALPARLLPLVQVALVLPALLSCAGAERRFSPSDTLRFDLRHPQSSLDEFSSRMGWPQPSARDLVENDYRVAEESFEVHVSSGCRLRPGCGLLVWVSDGNSGHLPPGWRGAVEDARLVWAGANASGDERSLSVRVNLALDAVANLRRLLEVDPDRIYVAGFAGGARAASVAALLYPEVFDGGVFLLGAAFFEPVPASDPQQRTWPRSFPPPPAARRAAAEAGRYVLVTGEADPSRAEMRDLARALRAEGFPDVSLLDRPDVGPGRPDGGTWRRALALLEGR